MGTKISAVIITKNEEDNILRCIDALQSITDEILVVDSGSTDRTLELIKSQNVTLIQTEWKGYAATKNLGNEHAKFDYILSIDADEKVSPELKNSILQAKRAGLTGTYSFNRLTNYLGSWIKNSGWYPDEKIRIFNKNEVKWEGEFVHETLAIPAEIKNLKLNGDLFHYSYSSLEDHRKRADKYSALTAQKLFEQGKPRSFLSPYLSPLFRFLKMYILQLGFMDGKAGWNIAMISAESNRFKYLELNRLHNLKRLKPNLNHIVISRTDSLGDMMLTLPMAKAIKDEIPHAKISVLGKAYTQPLVECCEYVDEFVLYEPNCSPSFSSSPDAVIHVLPSAFLAKHFKKIKVNMRIGSSRRIYNLLNCNKHVHFTRKNSELHESQLNLKMLSQLHLKSQYALDEIPSFYGFKPKAKLPSSVKSLLADKPKIILHPKSQGSAPEWNLKNFNDLAKELVKGGFQVFFSGTENEGELFRGSIDFTENITDVSGKMSLHEFISFIHACDGLVASSTGPLHIAAALDKAVVGLYSNQRPMFPTRWAPVGINAAYLENLPVNGELAISIHEVQEKIKNLL